ncbi:glycosyltransferase family 2 protein [Flavobacterium soyangense]|uniref:Glycosyltransferase family 2 protein n=1 Tax=Flavobacterium soyangense TaxID=2023265 RepID=A0A930UBR2_9FLAO|nr:glycosyltransferase family A protein [Flavobacterium soyangense]MBF2708386.1 glycosyltransferase family 2 protein [Flavobacterium soyangense]
MTNDFKKQDLEILVSTMNRNTLDFLIPMFPFCHFSDFSILIVNQTQENNLLVSEFPSIRVINSFEKGLSRSRNLALKNAIGKIVLIADDDVVYKKDFDTTIVHAHNQYNNKAVISFCIEKPNGMLFKKYLPNAKKDLSLLELFNVLSIEISINKLILDKLGITFDENFGLGSTFEMGEEAIFLSDIKEKNQQIAFVPSIIVMHSEISSIEKINFEQRYYIQGAFLSRVLKAYCFVGLVTKLFFDLKQKKLKMNHIPEAIKNANQGKIDYYYILNNEDTVN